ncbi:hypothetical protein PI95_022820 [Hassallia byssoidea VB512170]|uniref:Uncharacterized protein n=1 Tax=Hassallia byssoidea VB512170 TaxID=1304833 RepID=A0A846HET5_9CYAN|nr:hypothetical protein [Hassalia byssoidea]NEU75309.1 hypothetical protein [Hassalia byssoidea VB512170]
MLRVQQYSTILNSVDELRQFVEQKRLSLPPNRKPNNMKAIAPNRLLRVRSPST